MKKLIAIALSAVILLTMSVTVFAEPATLPELLADNSIETTRAIEVPVDIQFDIEQDGSFTDGPVTKKYTSDGLTADYKATIYMSDVRNAYTTYMTAANLLVAGMPELEAQLANCRITGEFEIKIIYPETAEIPSEIEEGSDLFGFNDEASNVFEETGRTITEGETNGTKELTINIAVKSPYVLASDMTANLDTYLPDLTLTCEDVTLKSQGENKVIGKITGSTLIHDENEELVATIEYTGKQGTEEDGITGSTISETVKLTTSQGAQGGIPAGPNTNASASSPSTGTTTQPKDITVTIKLPNADAVEPVVIPSTETNPTINIDEITEEINPQREGFAFAGFYDTPNYSNKLEGEVPVTADTTIYARWINTTTPDAFDADSHIKYINGYPDGTVQPEANITREEIVTIFYRLLKADKRAALETTENNFTDVAADRWSNTAISTMANGGYIKGYEDGTFVPSGKITRAELAAIASRFLGSEVTGERAFSDISGHWAETKILSIANSEWILGYEDGTFRPDANLTRAEAMAIINRIVVRYVDAQGLTGNEIQWPDNLESAWYYFDVIEASNEHDMTRAENGYHEIWTSAE